MSHNACIHPNHRPHVAYRPVVAACLMAALWLPGPASEARNVQYQYDSLSRVTRVIYDSCTTVEYDYDAAGNVTATRTLVDNSLDEDCDNVSDGTDACPGTPPGAIVTNEGCTVEQACPCSGPRTGGAWGTHAAYVSCVTTAADELLGAGKITMGDRDVIVADAQASTCGVNNPPDLVDDTAMTDACHPVVVDVLANDSDIEDGAGSNLSITMVSGATFGSAVVFDDAGVDKIRYTPDPGATGVENLSYTAVDSGGASASAALVVTVNATPDGDGDGVMNSCDNCLLVANADQCNTNDTVDHYGNACDGDLDQNGITNSFDLTIMRENFGATGANDADLTCNGTVNTFDLTELRGLFGQPPGPSGLP